MESLRGATTSLVTVGVLLAGCSDRSPEHHAIPTTTLEQRNPDTGLSAADFDFNFEFGEFSGDRSTSLGINPDELPYEDVEKIGDLADENKHYIYHTVARVEVNGTRIEYKPHTDLNDHVSDIFKMSVGESEPMIRAAAARGTLREILFTRPLPGDTDNTSSFNPITGVIRINIREQGMSFDELSVTGKHEAFHADTFKLNFTRDEWDKDYDKACDGIETLYRPRSLQYVSEVVDKLIQLYGQSKQHDPADYKKFVPALEKIRAYLDSDSDKALDQIFMYCGELSVMYALSDLDKAANNIGQDGLGNLSIYDMQVSQPVKDLPDSDPTKRALFREFIEGDTLYRDLNESEYVESDSAGSRFLGHTAEADNFNEMFASVLDISTNYTDKFVNKLREMKPEEQHFVITFMRLLYDHTIQLNPGLAGLISQKEAVILDAIRSK